MKFCPKCDARLRKRGENLRCPKCDYAEEDMDETAKAPGTQEGAVSEFNVLEGGDDDAMLPSVKAECTKCGNDEAVWWMLQTRSADEPTTQFYRCTKCRYTWRDYS